MKGTLFGSIKQCACLELEGCPLKAHGRFGRVGGAVPAVSSCTPRYPFPAVRHGGLSVCDACVCRPQCTCIATYNERARKTGTGRMSGGEGHVGLLGAWLGVTERLVAQVDGDGVRVLAWELADE